MAKSSLGCCLLKIFAVLCLLAVMAMGVAGFFVWRTYNWFATIPQKTPAAYAKLELGEGEKQDVDRLITEIGEAKNKRGIIDESITPDVFNGVIDKVMEINKSEGKKSDLVAVRAGFQGEHFTLAFTAKDNDKPGQEQLYWNFVATFDLMVEDGQITKFDLIDLKAGDHETPMVARTIIDRVMLSVNDALKQPNADKKARDAAETLRLFKLIKREGDRIHIILDTSKIPTGGAQPKVHGDKEEDEAEIIEPPKKAKRESF